MGGGRSRRGGGRRGREAVAEAAAARALLIVGLVEEDVLAITSLGWAGKVGLASAPVRSALTRWIRCTAAPLLCCCVRALARRLSGKVLEPAVHGDAVLEAQLLPKLHPNLVTALAHLQRDDLTRLR